MCVRLEQDGLVADMFPTVPEMTLWWNIVQDLLQVLSDLIKSTEVEMSWGEFSYPESIQLWTKVDIYSTPDWNWIVTQLCHDYSCGWNKKYHPYTHT